MVNCETTKQQSYLANLKFPDNNNGVALNCDWICKSTEQS